MDEWRRLRLVRRVRTAVEHLNEARRQAADHGQLPGYLEELAAKAMIGWIHGRTPEEWIRVNRLEPADLEGLREAGVWPWGREADLDDALRLAQIDVRELALAGG